MARKFKAIIVDDEEFARKDLRNALKRVGGVEVIREANNLSEAERQIRSCKPDIVFLDIRFPGESGFELLERMPRSVHVIFVTAYDKYAIKAFEVNALDYLLKPVDPGRLKTSLDRVSGTEEDGGRAAVRLEYDDSIFLKLGGKYRFVKISSILVITAEADYTEITTSSMKKGLAHKTMKEWDRRLPKRRFIRIHRSTIVNSDYIERVEQWLNYSFRVFMKDIAEPFMMSKRYAEKNRKELG
jgi:two-component system LytT family response regulator